MPFRDPKDEAARIQAICRGWLTRQRLRYPCFYFPPRRATPDSRRYRAPAYRNDDWVYWDRQQYLDRHCGLETESGDCVDQGTSHSLENTSHGEGTEAYCDWCWKDILGSDRCFTCSSCDFDVCIECMEYAVQNGKGVIYGDSFGSSRIKTFKVSEYSINYIMHYSSIYLKSTVK